MITCLGVIPQNDLNKVAERADITGFIERGNRDVESALKKDSSSYCLSGIDLVEILLENGVEVMYIELLLMIS